MRKVTVALLSAIVAGMMLVPGSASATDEGIPDVEGDVGFVWDSQTGEIMDVGLGNSPVVMAGYFDMKSFWLRQEGDTYTFGMELYSDVPDPEEGDALPHGIMLAEWDVYIDAVAWNPVLAPGNGLFRIGLTYDGSVYAAHLLRFSDMYTIPLTTFTHIGREVTISFKAVSIGSPESFWWMPTVRAWWGPPNSIAYHLVDMPDWGINDDGEIWVATLGQEWYSIPWPLPPTPPPPT